MYCTPKSGVPLFKHSELLTSEEITRVVAVAHRYGLKKVRITGGEPLVRRDIIPLVASLKGHVGIRDLSLTTNGVLLPEMAQPLKAAGLDRVNISLDTMDPDRYRAITRGGDIERVWEAIEKAAEAGLSPIKINVVLLRGVNDDELHKFALLTLDKPYHIRFIEYMPVGRHAGGQNQAVSTAEIKKRLSIVGTLVPLKFRGQGPSRNYRFDGAPGVIGFISAVSDHFCGYCNRLRLTATGMLRPCLFSVRSVDLRTALRLGVTDEELSSLFEQAVAIKPRGHSLATDPAPANSFDAMSQIGG
jgi:cyclic pyranopterin phosphate synthase